MTIIGDCNNIHLLVMLDWPWTTSRQECGYQSAGWSCNNSCLPSVHSEFITVLKTDGIIYYSHSCWVKWTTMNPRGYTCGVMLSVHIPVKSRIVNNEMAILFSGIVYSVFVIRRLVTKCQNKPQRNNIHRFVLS